MYNCQKVYDLLKAKNLKKGDLLEYLGLNPASSITQYLNIDIKSSRLEAIADFFDLPTDYFFDRGKIYDNGQSVNVAGNSNSKIRISQILEREQSLRSLVEEKEKRIKLLEEMNEILKSTIDDLRAQRDNGK